MIYEYQQIKQFVQEQGYPAYRYEQLIQSVFSRRIADYARMNVLPQNLRDSLAHEYGSSFCSMRPKSISASQQVKMTLLALPDGNSIESVALRYKKGWESFCISSQCGCSLGCKFCATGAMGLKRSLTAKEITDQLLYFYLAGHTLDSVSFMGMGEPFANPNVFNALKLLTDPHYFGLSQRKITISTVGILPGIRRLTREYPQVNLAFSLHSPFERQRSELMPINQKYPLHEVMGVLDEHVDKTRRKVFIAYTLIDKVNDTPEHAKALAKLLQSKAKRTHLYHVDLIPYNPTEKCPHPYRTVNSTRKRRFYDVLKAAGISVTTRAQFGSDINAACGQLHGKQECG